MRKLVSTMMLALLAQTSHGADAPLAPLYAGALPPLPSDQEVVILEITVPPGGTGNPHRHDAYVYVYMLEGAVDMQVKGGPVTRVEAGQVFTESPDDVHVMNNNASKTEPARFLAVMIKAKDAPVVLPAE